MNTETMNNIAILKKLVAEAGSTVFFGGAGVSTASGIPDFRGTNGLYTETTYKGLPPEYLLSARCLNTAPELFYDYYRHSMIYPDAHPNDAHSALAELERSGRLTAVVTQNIDGLHQKAGSRNVLELHGTTSRYYCKRCLKQYGEEIIGSTDGVPRCSCGGMIRPDVVMYGEGLDEAVFSAAEQAIRQADVLIVGGTSLTVNPAASLVSAYRGKHLAIINYQETPYDFCAEYIIRESVADVLPMLV